MGFTHSQQVALSVLPHVTAPLSVFGSAVIIREVLSDQRKRSLVYHRLLLAMSICDVLTSLAFFFSTWPIPSGTPGVFAASGTTGTCTAQGTFIQFGVVTPMYNASLSIYYALVVKLGWKERQLRRAEPLMHAVPLVIGCGTTVASLALKLINNANLWCWIAPLPLGCKDTYRYGPDEANCVRGNNSWIYRWAFFFAFVWASILLAMIAMVVVYSAVFKQERESARYRYGSTARRNSSAQSILSTVTNRSILRRSRQQKQNSEKRKHSGRVASQALWYLLAFYLSWGFATINRVLQLIIGRTFFPIILLHSAFTPMQGFLNFIVYLRPRYLTYRRRYGEGLGRLEILGWILREVMTGHVITPSNDTLHDARRSTRNATRGTVTRRSYTKPSPPASASSLVRGQGTGTDTDRDKVNNNNTAVALQTFDSNSSVAVPVAMEEKYELDEERQTHHDEEGGDGHDDDSEIDGVGPSKDKLTSSQTTSTLATFCAEDRPATEEEGGEDEDRKGDSTTTTGATELSPAPSNLRDSVRQSIRGIGFVRMMSIMPRPRTTDRRMQLTRQKSRRSIFAEEGSYNTPYICMDEDDGSENDGDDDENDNNDVDGNESDSNRSICMDQDDGSENDGDDDKNGNNDVDGNESDDNLGTERQ